MPRIHVHDFSFDYVRLDESESSENFFCSVKVYFNFSPEDPGDNFDDLEYFAITVANPDGLASYLNRAIRKGFRSSISILSSVVIFDHLNEDEIMIFLKGELQSIWGKTERELILKAIRHFYWEGEETPEVYMRLFI